MLNEFLTVVNDAKGNISSRRFRKEYFIKQNKNYLWEWFEEQKVNFENYTDREIVILLQNGYIEPPKCIVCGKDSKVQTYTSVYTFDYCSKECSLKSDTRREKLSNTKKSYSDERKEEIESKRKATNLEKYGVEYQSQREEVKGIVGNKASVRQIDQNVKSLLVDYDWMYNEYFTKKRSASDIADELKIYYGTVIDYLQQHNFPIRKGGYSDSLPQKQIYEFIKSIYDGEVVYNDWSVLGNKELDIYIPDFNFAIEHNGLYSHTLDETTDIPKNRNRHLLKTILCEEKGIDLFHIRGDQWIKQKEIIKSMIKHKIGLTEETIYARKCEIKQVKHDTDFLINNHIQGTVSINSAIKYGLYYNNELVSIMTFCKPRHDNSVGDWELLRFANKINVNVVGAFSKLLNHFRKNYSGKIISYCDRSRSNGNVYSKNNFILVNKEYLPGFWWTNMHTVWYRKMSSHNNLSKLYEDGRIKFYDQKLSQKKNMFMNGYKLYYDCGQMTFLLE